MEKQFKIAIIGLGYVGLPLLLEFSRKYNTIGYDKDLKRIKSLQLGIDVNKDVDLKSIKNHKKIILTSSKKKLLEFNFFIVCVPTPINRNKKPNLRNLKEASKIVGDIISDKNIVVFESTVYPGVTENFCVPIIEKYSKLKCITNNSKQKKGFYIGYSPERINPGDKIHNLKNISKLVSSNNAIALKKIFYVYNMIIKAKVVKVKSIKICESAKIIENIQRDVNIALMNEFAKIFGKMGLDVNEIINTASTKWNFAKYYPGLVGGHCIGVDPYYLSYLSKKNKIKPKMILSGRKINDEMYKYVLNLVKKNAKLKRINITNSSILIMGYSFKENCSDTRNTQVEKIFNFFDKVSPITHIYDPLVNIEDLPARVKKSFIKTPRSKYYDLIIIPVPHKIFINKKSKFITKLLKKNSIVFDLKSAFKNKKFLTL